MQDTILIKIKEIIKTSKPDGIVTKLRHNIELWPIILEYTKNFQFQNKSEQVYFYSEQLKSKPQCKCGKAVTFVSIVLGYREFCSRSCTYAKEAALERRVAAMKSNGGVGLANPKTYLKAKGKLQEKYGEDVINPGQLKSHRESMVINNPMFLEETKKKLEKTCEEKYGLGRNNPGRKNCTDDQIEILINDDKFASIVKGRNAVTIANETGLNHSTIMRRAYKLDLIDTMDYKPPSAMENDLALWLDSMDINYQRRNRKILSNQLELDFYFPQWNLAVELHGLYHHSEISGKKDKRYHQQKYLGCQIKNIQLLQFWQDEYWQHSNVIRSKILYLASMIQNKIPARKCKLMVLTDSVLERDFMNKNHIQGFADYRQWSLGAWYNDELVGVMSFSNQMKRLELVRYATKIDAVASGLFSKMLKKSISEFEFSGSIVSLSDNRISNGRLYYNSGFTFVNESNPGYCYTYDYETRINRQQCMKHKLVKRHDLDPATLNTITEWELAQNLGYDRLWDAGKKKWIIKI